MSPAKKKTRKPVRAKVAQRPAETGGIAAAVAALILKLVGVDDPDTLIYLTIIVGFVPAAITWLAVTVRGRS